MYVIKIGEQYVGADGLTDRQAEAVRIPADIKAIVSEHSWRKSFANLHEPVLGIPIARFVRLRLRSQ